MKKAQIRLTVDEEMGPFFEWFMARNVKIRAREFLALTRIGFGVVYGAKGPGELAADQPAQLLAVQGSAPQASGSPNGGRALESEGAGFARSFLTATPPAHEVLEA